MPAASRTCRAEPPKLRVIGDISCDIDGSVEITAKATDSEQPCFVYEPATGRIRDGYAGNGPVVMAVDNLPCELPRESSEHFSRALRDLVAEFGRWDCNAALEDSTLPDALKRAVIAERGRLRPRFAHLQDCLARLGPEA